MKGNIFEMVPRRFECLKWEGYVEKYINAKTLQEAKKDKDFNPTIHVLRKVPQNVVYNRKKRLEDELKKFNIRKLK